MLKKDLENTTSANQNSPIVGYPGNSSIKSHFMLFKFNLIGKKLVLSS